MNVAITISTKVEWCPIILALPAKNGRYLITKIMGGIECVDIVNYVEGEWHTGCEVIAWAPLPEPYQEK